MKTYKDSRNSMFLLGTRGIAVMVVSALIVLSASHSVGASTVWINGKELISYKQGSQLPGACNYEWWYGCSPTSAGMMMGYYDRNGYNSVPYGNLVPGGLAEQNTFGNPSALVNNIIASPGHVTDFYNGVYGASGDDLSPPWHSFDCLADFMATSQDSALNANGSTTFWFYTDNSPLYESDIYSAGPSYYDASGMYGIGEYLESAGYDADVLYNQRIFGYDNVQAGFTLAQYQAEIDAGRPVMIHVIGHSMLGYGYLDGTNDIYVFDTWAPGGQNPGIMTWGGAYPYDSYSLEHLGVTVLTPAPEPATVLLLGLGGLALLRRKRGYGA